MPGTCVAIGWNSPRISGGRVGFMSHRSIWLGPPKRNRKTHEFARGCGGGSICRRRFRPQSVELRATQPQQAEAADAEQLAAAVALNEWNHAALVSGIVVDSIPKQREQLIRKAPRRLQSPQWHRSRTPNPSSASLPRRAV